ncbi:hypothetical protein FE257_001109 [Aspergillus nanangensis]|uniref:Ketosynthase family 3 (KS3) domain-containing protein n=1 Tax=Aspergillus nanangensis TaxID=2582783 RepID=A0AAD4GX78_ASPNN|nr:hypothetical protein FE257_001109 [Aspergillus nanangensis]
MTMPIAICGMGMRLPGGIHDADTLYNFLINKKDARSPTSTARFNISSFYNPKSSSSPNTLSMNHGYWLHDTSLTHLDSSMFPIPPTEGSALDPQQKLLLEVVYEALETAGQAHWRSHNIGCYVGTFGDDWQTLVRLDDQSTDPYVLSHMDLGLSSRVAYEYDLRGPSMTVKVGCSAAGLALHLACQAIGQGDCDAAVVAGTSLILSPDIAVDISRLGAVSADASCKSFDAQADGYARAEGVNALFVKRLDLALRDGNPIRAVVRGTSTNTDGQTVGITNPSQEAQERLIRRAYERAGIEELQRTAMVECHATGTPVGDPTEARAISEVFGAEGMYIGSVKPNLGHSEGAAAITSVLKAVVSLENKTIIPNIKFQTPNPNSESDFTTVRDLIMIY